MAFVLEDGTGIEDSNSYASEDMLSDYADDRAVTLADGDAEAALIRATSTLDSLYWNRYPGTRTNGRDQGLEWPRTGATDRAGNTIADDEIPQEILDATCELGIRELASPGSTLPDLERGGSIKSIKAGSVEIVYGSNATANTLMQSVSGILGPLLGGGVLPSLFSTATRG